MIRRIAITGPESTGKSKLAAELADYYHTAWTPEYAREYLEKYGPEYQLDDIVKIAMGQLAAEEKEWKKARQYLFCDTDFIVTRIWAEHAFHQCPDWILDKVINHRYDLYLLCDIDLPWQPDPLREHPDLRQYFFDQYLHILSSLDLHVGIVRGTGTERTENAIKIIEQRFTTDTVI